MSDVFDMEDWMAERRDADEALFDGLKKVFLADAIKYWRDTMKNSEIRRRNRRSIKELIEFGVIKLRREDGHMVTVGDFYNRDQNALVEEINKITHERLHCVSKKDYYLTYLRFIDYLHEISNGLFGKEKMKTWTCNKRCCNLYLWRDEFPITQQLKKEYIA